MLTTLNSLSGHPNTVALHVRSHSLAAGGDRQGHRKGGPTQQRTLSCRSGVISAPRAHTPSPACAPAHPRPKLLRSRSPLFDACSCSSFLARFIADF